MSEPLAHCVLPWLTRPEKLHTGLTQTAANLLCLSGTMSMQNDMCTAMYQLPSGNQIKQVHTLLAKY